MLHAEDEKTADGVRVDLSSTDDRGGPQSPSPDHDDIEHNVTKHHHHDAGKAPQEEAQNGQPDKKGKDKSKGAKQAAFGNIMATRVTFIPTNRQGQLYTEYVKTLPGILKLVEIVLCLILFILAICSDRNMTTAAWTEHFAFSGFLILCALMIGFVVFPHLTIKEEPTREGLIVLELLFYGFYTLMFFIAIWLMIHLSASWQVDGRGAAIISAIICVALAILFAFETFKRFQLWRNENSSSHVITNSGTVPARNYETNAELSRQTGSEFA